MSEWNMNRLRSVALRSVASMFDAGYLLFLLSSAIFSRAQLLHFMNDVGRVRDLTRCKETI